MASPSTAKQHRWLCFRTCCAGSSARAMAKERNISRAIRAAMTRSPAPSRSICEPGDGAIFPTPPRAVIRFPWPPLSVACRKSKPRGACRSCWGWKDAAMSALGQFETFADDRGYFRFEPEAVVIVPSSGNRRAADNGRCGWQRRSWASSGQTLNGKSRQDRGRGLLACFRQALRCIHVNMSRS